MKTQTNHRVIDLQDQDTYHQVFMKFYASLCRYAETLLGQQADAEDVVSNVFVKLWHLQRVFPDAEYLKAYLYRSTKNACIDFIRMNHHQGERNAIFLTRSDQIEQGYLEAMVYRELLRELYAALEGLPEDERLIIRLGYLEGHSNQEVAELTGLALQTVKNKKLRALSRLRKRLSRDQFTLLLHISWAQLIHFTLN